MVREPFYIALNCHNLKNGEKPAFTLQTKMQMHGRIGKSDCENIITTKILYPPPFLSQVQFLLVAPLTMNLVIYRRCNSLKNNVIIKYAHYLEHFQNIQIFIFE